MLATKFKKKHTSPVLNNNNIINNVNINNNIIINSNTNNINNINDNNNKHQVYSNSYDNISTPLTSPTSDPEPTNKRESTLKHKTSLLFKKSSILSRSNSSKLAIGTPQNFKHLYHMDTTSNEHENGDINSDEPKMSLENAHLHNNINAKSPDSITTSLFTNDKDFYDETNTTVTTSSPILRYQPSNINNSTNIQKNNSSINSRTSLTTNSISSMIFDNNKKTNIPSSSGSFSTTNSSDLVLNNNINNKNNLKINSIIPENENDKIQNPYFNSINTNTNINTTNTSNSPSSLNIAEFADPFTSEINNSNNKSLLSPSSSLSSLNLHKNNTNAPQFTNILKHDKFLNSSKFDAPNYGNPSSPTHSEDSTQTIKINNLEEEIKKSPILLNKDFSPPSMNLRPTVKKSRSFKNLKKSLNRHLPGNKNKFFNKPNNNNFDNRSQISLMTSDSDKSLTRFSPEEVSSSLKNEVAVLKHLSFENKNKDSFEIDFDREVIDEIEEEMEENESSTNSTSPISINKELRTTRSRKNTTNSTFSAISFNTTKAPSNSNSKNSSPSKRRSTVYIRQSWLKDEVLGIYKDGDINKTLDLLSEQITEEETLEQKLEPDTKPFDKIEEVSEIGQVEEVQEVKQIDQSLNKMDLNDYLVPFAATKKRSIEPFDKVEFIDEPTDESVESDGPTKKTEVQDELPAVEIINDNDSSESIKNLTFKPVENELSESFSFPNVSPFTTEEALVKPSNNLATNDLFINYGRTRSENDLNNIAFLEVENIKNELFFINEDSESVNNNKTSKFSLASLKRPVISTNNNTLIPRKSFHDRSLSIASSIYSQDLIPATNHSRSSSHYNNSVDDLLQINNKRNSEIGEKVVKKKITVDRNSYIQFNFNKFEDFKMGLDVNNE